MKFLILLALISCALASSLGNIRISGGDPATLDDFPYIVSVRANGFHVCSGIIISSNWILTAASCVAGVHDKFVTVNYGTVDRVDTGITADIAEVVENDGFKRYNLPNDIALLRTAAPLDCNAYKTVAPLATVNEFLPEGMDAKVAGWGFTGITSGELTGQLRKFVGRVADIEICSANYKGLIDINADASVASITQLCVGKADHGVVSVCHGDGGSPAIGVVKGFQKVYGIASFGKGCGNEKDHPSVFTLIAPFRTWIRTVTKEEV